MQKDDGDVTYLAFASSARENGTHGFSMLNSTNEQPEVGRGVIGYWWCYQ